MAAGSDYNTDHGFALSVYWAYAGLVSSINANLPPALEPNLGGKLIYAGELDEEGRALVVAANIAGAGSLCATADPAAQKQAIRDGVADFLVNSLDEALRILKNEIRKRETVSICVALPPETMESEMLERGVLPDLWRPSTGSSERAREHQNPTSGPDASNPIAEPVIVVWSVTSAPALWLPILDAIAANCLDAYAGRARRWVRLAPRYLGRLAKGVRLLVNDRRFAASFTERVQERVESGEIAVPVEIRVSLPSGGEVHQISPKK